MKPVSKAGLSAFSAGDLGMPEKARPDFFMYEMN